MLRSELSVSLRSTEDRFSTYDSVMTMQKKPLDTSSLGREGEDIAAKYLRKKGWDLLDRNVRFRSGEIDIVARQGETVVIVEVKSGSASRAFSPLSHFTEAKQRKLLGLAKLYLMKWKEPPSIRFDLLVVIKNGDSARVDHFEDVIQDGAP